MNEFKRIDDKNFLDQEIDKIINGTVDLYQMTGGIYEDDPKYTYDQLIKYPNNANCLYHLALLVLNYSKKMGIDKGQYIEYLKRAAEYNHPNSLFDLGFKYFNRDQSKNRKEAIELGTQAFINGYDNIITSCSEYYDTIYRNECMLEAITRLKEQNRELEIQNKKLKKKNHILNMDYEQEKCRPPERGGSEYEKAAQHFKDLNNK